MSPALPQNNLAYTNLCDSKFLGHLGLGFSARSTATDLQNGYVREFGTGTLGTTKVWVGASPRSPLSMAISRVLNVSSKPKVIWPNARRVVAVVENAHFNRDWPEVEFPRDTVGTVGALAGDGDLAVSVLVPTTAPGPAFARLVHLCPKPFDYRFTGILTRHLELLIRGVMRTGVSALRPLSIVPRPLSADGNLALGAGMVAI